MNTSGVSRIASKDQSEAVYIPDGDSHRWILPSALLEVYLHSDALRRLAHDLAVVRMRARAGEQIGGLLLGSADALGRISLRIATVETYSAAALHQLLETVSQHPVEDLGYLEISVIGWYRVVSRDESGWSASDEALMRGRFSDPGHILLLIRPSESDTSPLQLVFWRGRELGLAHSEFPQLPGARRIAAPRPLEVRPAAPVAAAAPQIALAPEQLAPRAHISMDPAEPFEALGVASTEPQQALAPSPVQPPQTWKLLALAAATAILVFSGGILWNRATTRQRPPEAAISVPQQRTGEIAPPQANREILPPEASPVQVQTQTVTVPAVRAPGVRVPAASPPAIPVREFKPPEAPAPQKKAEEAALPAAPAPQPRAISTPDLAKLQMPAQSAPAPPRTETAVPVVPTPPAPSASVPAAGTAASAPVTQAATPPHEPARPAEIVPAVALKQAQPVVPVNLRSLITHRMTVELKVTVDPSGRVTKTEPVAVQGALATSLAKVAANAAHLWTFKPALFDGKPVLSVANIQFTFEPRR